MKKLRKRELHLVFDKKGGGINWHARVITSPDEDGVMRTEACSIVLHGDGRATIVPNGYEKQRVGFKQPAQAAE